MFRKKIQEVAQTTEATLQVPGEPTAEEKDVFQVKQTSRRCTVIAQNTLFTGNVEIEGDIHVYGKMKGNINLKDGVLYVMREGFLEGEFSAPSVVINGRVLGTCVGESVEIQEHGEMEGIIRSVALSIRPGGCFVGNSERLAVKKEVEPKRVVEIKKHQPEKMVEKTAEA